MNENFDFAPIRYTFSLFQPLGFTLHFSCCKIKAVLSFCSIHVLYPYPHRAWQQMDLRFFPHASKHKCDNVCTDTCRSDCCPLRDPCRQRSWQAAIFAGIDPRPLSRYRSFAATFTPGDHRSLGDSRTCPSALSAPCALSPFKFTQQFTSLLNCPVGKNICRVILFEFILKWNTDSPITETSTMRTRVHGPELFPIL